MKKTIYFIGIIVICCTLCGCDKENDEKKSIEEKVDYEIEYFEDTIFDVINKCIKNEYVGEKELDWNLVRDDAEKFNISWCTLELDLIQLKIENEKIIEFGKCINNVLIAISYHNDMELLENLYQMSEGLCNIKDGYSEDKNSVKKMRVKSESLEVYNNAFKSDFDSASSQMSELKNYYQELMNDQAYLNDNAYNLNKVYLLIEEYDVALQTQNLPLIKMKYANLIEKMY